VSTPSDPGSGQQPDPWAAPPANASGQGAPPPMPPEPPAYGQPVPPPAYGQPVPPPGYGQPVPPPAYGQAPYGGPQPGYGQPAPGYGYQPVPTYSYASWGKRVGGALIDYYAVFVVAIIFVFAHVYILAVLLYIAGIVWALYNAYKGGATGQSYGKKTVGIRLVKETTGQPIGGGLGIGRYFLHVVDSIPCVPVGLLWPLWDAKKQTFADKILGSVVINV
jgi:uncharacterized RDD family membrane protein YckC